MFFSIAIVYCFGVIDVFVLQVIMSIDEVDEEVTIS